MRSPTRIKSEVIQKIIAILMLHQKIFSLRHRPYSIPRRVYATRAESLPPHTSRPFALLHNNTKYFQNGGHKACGTRCNKNFSPKDETPRAEIQNYTHIIMSFFLSSLVNFYMYPHKLFITAWLIPVVTFYTPHNIFYNPNAILLPTFWFYDLQPSTHFLGYMYTRVFSLIFVSSAHFGNL